MRFAEDGFGVGLRAIAADAGVSAGLVAHHFGSKAGLREVCDAHVLEMVRGVKAELVGPAPAGMLLAQLAAIEDAAPIAGYVLRTLQEGGPAARDFVENVISDAADYIAEGVAAGTLVPSRDEAARSRYLAHQSLGALVLAYTLERDPEEDLATWFARYAGEILGPALELYTEGFFADRTMLETYLSSNPAKEQR